MKHLIVTLIILILLAGLIACDLTGEAGGRRATPRDPTKVVTLPTEALVMPKATISRQPMAFPTVSVPLPPTLPVPWTRVVPLPPQANITAIEIIQGIQNLDNDMSPVKDRRTYARVYVKSSASTDVADVNGILCGSRNGQSLG